MIFNFPPPGKITIFGERYHFIGDTYIKIRCNFAAEKLINRYDYKKIVCC